MGCATYGEKGSCLLAPLLLLTESDEAEHFGLQVHVLARVPEGGGGGGLDGGLEGGQRGVRGG